MVAIIDYGAGNLQSVKKALDYLGYQNEITQDKDKINKASHVILPGVGSFGDAMDSIKSRDLYDTIKNSANGEKPFLGICLGLQLLFNSSEETQGVKGLDVFDGDIIAIPKNLGLKVPHIGWNSLTINDNKPLFKDIPQDSYFYFVHSFYLANANETQVAATTNYGVNIQCAMEDGLVCATQFHPEKSGEIGLQLLKNFMAMEG